MYRSGLVDMLVTHTDIEGFGLTPLSGDCRDNMPPLLKTKTIVSKSAEIGGGEQLTPCPPISTGPVDY